MTGEKDQPDALDEIFLKALEMLRQPLPTATTEAPPIEAMMNHTRPGHMRDRPEPGKPTPERIQQPALLHGLVDDATFKTWLLDEIKSLSDLIADDDESIAHSQARLERLRLRRVRLAKLRQAFETLLDDIGSNESS